MHHVHKQSVDEYDEPIHILNKKKTFQVKQSLASKIMSVLERIRFVLRKNKETWVDLSKVIKITSLTSKSQAKVVLKYLSTHPEVNKMKLMRLLISISEDDLGCFFVRENLVELRGYVFKYEIKNIFSNRMFSMLLDLTPL